MHSEDSQNFKTFHGTHILGASRGLLCDSSSVLLDDRTATQYHRLLASSCCPSVCLSVTLCIVALKAAVQGYKLYQRVLSRHVPICPFRHFCYRMFRLVTKRTTKKRENATVSFHDHVYICSDFITYCSPASSVVMLEWI